MTHGSSRSCGSTSSPTLAFSALADQSEVDEQQGLMFLLAGAVLAFRNPRAHHAARTRPRKGRANLKRAEPWGGPNTVVCLAREDPVQLHALPQRPGQPRASRVGRSVARESARTRC